MTSHGRREEKKRKYDIKSNGYRGRGFCPLWVWKGRNDSGVAIAPLYQLII